MRKPAERTRAPIGNLSVLPVFYKLSGAPVFIAGGSDEALWKAQLLLAAGARLTICADVLSEGFAQLIAQNRERIVVHQRDWFERDLIGKRMALGAFEDDEAASEFAKAARRAGVPVNVIDKPAFCDFQFGSIVNRAPVVVSISTDGAAPTIAQAIRQRIEFLLPRELGAWAAAAKGLRKKAAGLLPQRAARVAFWRNFARAAFNAPQSDPATTANALFNTAPKSGGLVSLVGAGPGAADLLTVRAVRALQSADVILFDDLVSDDVLEFARREAKRITVGKRGGRASCKQDDINALMVRLAKDGKRVVRLKSGDPMIFGRAGEEISRLEREGIEVEVVPGVTAALAAASALKTSLTHRDMAQSVKFVTAHSRHAALPELDWRACADQATTLMVYMGARTAPALARKLINNGMDETLPVAIMRAISKPTQHIEECTLSDLLGAQISSTDPVLIGVGKVFAGAGARTAEITPELADMIAANDEGEAPKSVNAKSSNGLN